jgi:hypothetical protein
MRRGVALAALATAGLTIVSLLGPGHSPGRAAALPAPIRAAFYYPWYPSAWRQKGVYPYTRYKPTLGYYSSTDAAVIRRHVAAMRYARIQAGISSWWGRGHRTDTAFARILDVTHTLKNGFRWAVYYEAEGRADPSVADLSADLEYLRTRYAGRPEYLKVGGRFVVFVYADGRDRCDMADRWHAANTVGAYVVLKVFAGYRSCANQPDGWHQYAPAKSTDAQPGYAFTVSPGFFKVGEAAPRLQRDVARWRTDVRAMIASRAPFQLVATFNEWGEGTAVESAAGWATRSGYGAYLDILRTPAQTPAAPPAPPPVVAGSTVLVAGGDIASCNSTGDETTARLAEALPGTVALLGDNAYESGSPAEYANCYDPTWGRFKARTRPAPGNHEYLTPAAAGYFGYFGAAAGAPDKGYYSYELGSWHIVVLNSNCPIVSCSRNSPQETWLRADLAAHPATCTLAYWHHPRFSSGQHGDDPRVSPLWQALADAGADVVLSGHDHDYERFVALAPDGTADAAHGIVEFVVGTGGRSHYRFTRPQPSTSVVRNDDTFGVLQLTLRPTGYDWKFVAEPGKTFADAGSANCH